jgi:arylsulfatase A-like enzyme/Tfp pilus assembly protein PilF
MSANARLWLLLLVSIATACGSQPPVAPTRPNLLLVSVDTLRADRVGNGTAPTIDGVAANGLRFTNARTVAPLTLPAHTSILTGLRPPEHGVRLNGVVVSSRQSTVAHRLREHGYHTAAVVGAFVLDRRFGLADGFDVYDDDIKRDPAAAERLEAERPADVVIDRAIAWLERAGTSRPWFLWVHLYDPHAPYERPGPTADLASAYDEEVRFADRELGRLVAAIDRLGLRQRTGIVIAGDHGEGLGEHGESTHGMLLFDSTLHVPLIVEAPGVTPAVRGDPASLIDIAPTLFALAGVASDSTSRGRSVLQAAEPDRELYAETDYPEAAGWQAGRALIEGRFKLIASGKSQLFDVSTDRSEQHNLSEARAQTRTAMATRLETLAKPSANAPSASRVVDAETASRLRALGYVSTSGVQASKGEGRDPADHTESWAAFERALSVRVRGDIRGALPVFEDLARRYPDAPIFETTYAQSLAEVGRTDEALKVLRAMVGRRANDAVLYHELAVVARSAGRSDEAQRAERAALAIEPGFAAAHNGLGLLLADVGDHAGARQAFEEASRLDWSNGSYLANVGNARRALGDLEAARQAYQTALERDDSLTDAANGLGVILVQQHRASEAVPWFERAIARDPTFAEAQLNLAIALHESGDRDRALSQYRVVEKMPSASARERAVARALRQQVGGRQ